MVAAAERPIMLEHAKKKSKWSESLPSSLRPESPRQSSDSAYDHRGQNHCRPTLVVRPRRSRAPSQCSGSPPFSSSALLLAPGVDETEVILLLSTSP